MVLAGKGVASCQMPQTFRRLIGVSTDPSQSQTHLCRDQDHEDRYHPSKPPEGRHRQDTGPSVFSLTSSNAARPHKRQGPVCDTKDDSASVSPQLFALLG